MIQARVSGNWHTLLTQLLLTSLLPHSISVKDNRLESASVIRWCRWTQVVSVKSNIKECVVNRMIGKWLPNVCISLCGEGFLPVYPALSFSWWGGLLWQNFIVLAYFIVWIKWGVSRVDEEPVVTRQKVSISKNSSQKVRVCYQKSVSPQELFYLGSEEKTLLLFLNERHRY